jgi:putative ABC transport system permease protein
MQSFLRNIRFSHRMIVKNPSLSLAVIATLVLGIGCTTAIYTIVYATLLAPLPFPHPEQLVMVWSKIDGHNSRISVGDFLDWKRQNKTFQQMAAWSYGVSFNLSSKDGPQQVDSRICTPGWFDMQGLPFMMGRDFLEEEGLPGKDHVAILTHKLWIKLGADHNILGKSIRLNGEPYNVVGVEAPGVGDRYDSELVVPLSFAPEQRNHKSHSLAVMGRLKSGVTMAQAQADMDAVAAQIADLNPETNKGWSTSVESLKNNFLPPVRIKNLWLLLGAVGFVLLLTCVNVANLLLARGAMRQKEIAIRSSIGATRGQVFMQFLTESVLLALIGGALGVLAAKFVLVLVLSIIPPGILPSEADFTLNMPVLIAALTITLFSGLLFGSAPAWFASRVDPNQALKEGGVTRTSGALRSRKMLITAEFALALTLLSGAGLAINSYWKLTHIDLGIRTDHALTFRLEQPDNRFASADEINSYQQTMLSAIRSIPGVSAVASSSGSPLLGPRNGGPFTIAGQMSAQDSLRRQGAAFQSVSPEYFKALGITIVRGRPFTDQDTSNGAHVVVVNEKFVTSYLSGKEPLGVRLMIAPPPTGPRPSGPIQPPPPIEWQIVGVFHDLKYRNLHDSFPEINMPGVQSPQPNASYIVRTELDPQQMAKSLATAVHSVDGEVALANFSTLDELKRQVVGEERFTMLLFASFAALAVLLAGVGIYGLMSFSVSQRTHEIGIRLALGSGRDRVIRLILTEASLLVTAGLTIGLIGAALVGRTLRATLYGVGAIDIKVLFAVFVVLGITALIGSYLPARRAASINPNEALRIE